jgi:hypothetical protein
VPKERTSRKIEQASGLLDINILGSAPQSGSGVSDMMAPVSREMHRFRASTAVARKQFQAPLEKVKCPISLT